MSHPSALAAKVAAVNRANAEVNRLAPLYRALFAQYEGEKIAKADSTLLAKVAAQLPAPLPGFQVFSPHVGCYVVKCSEQTAPYRNGVSIAHYAEPYFYAFTLDRTNGNLCKKCASEWEPLKADYSAEGIRAARAKVEAAQEAARKLEAEIGPFGMYDR